MVALARRRSTPDPPGPPIKKRESAFLYGCYRGGDLTGDEDNAWGLGSGILASQFDKGD